jgi:hypothetical protein
MHYCEIVYTAPSEPYLDKMTLFYTALYSQIRLCTVSIVRFPIAY